MPQYRYSLSEATEAKLQELAKVNEFPVSVMLNHIIREWYRAHMQKDAQAHSVEQTDVKQFSPAALFGEKRK